MACLKYGRMENHGSYSIHPSSGQGPTHGNTQPFQTLSENEVAVASSCRRHMILPLYSVILVPSSSEFDAICWKKAVSQNTSFAIPICRESDNQNCASATKGMYCTTNEYTETNQTSPDFWALVHPPGRVTCCSLGWNRRFPFHQTLFRWRCCSWWLC